MTATLELTGVGRLSGNAKANSVLVVRRCLTCKSELPAGVEGYCNEACFMKVGRAKPSPGRTGARRRRRRGGRKL